MRAVGVHRGLHRGHCARSSGPGASGQRALASDDHGERVPGGERYPRGPPAVRDHLPGAGHGRHGQEERPGSQAASGGDAGLCTGDRDGQDWHADGGTHDVRQDVGGGRVLRRQWQGLRPVRGHCAERAECAGGAGHCPHRGWHLRRQERQGRRAALAAADVRAVLQHGAGSRGGADEGRGGPLRVGVQRQLVRGAAGGGCCQGGRSPRCHQPAVPRGGTGALLVQPEDDAHRAPRHARGRCVGLLRRL
mmetsp:Transcript_28490/g.92346  ORF Transcript_28490/g.92346 Transcript_28490/m.92346 type:complete len:249 (+) Transcript_28490:1061-1807(+)